jgi:hypothetical protein
MKSIFSSPPKDSKSVEAERSRLVLDAARRLFDDKHLDATTLRALGIERDDPLAFGDHRLLPIVFEAGHAPGFGDRPIDERIRTFLDGTYGWRGWKMERSPYLWEKGGGDVELDQLIEEEEATIAGTSAAQETMWNAMASRSKLASDLRESRPVGRLEAKEAEKAVVAATKAWEEARERESLARGQVGNRQLYLQRRFLDEQAQHLAKK